MKRKLLLIIVCFIIAIFQIGCNNKGKNIEKNLKYIRNIDSYSCDVNINIKNDKQVINYSGKQFYSKIYGCRFDLDKTRIFVYKDNKVFIKDLKNGLTYNVDENLDSIFKLCFVSEYINLLYTDESVKSSFKTVNNQEYQVVHLGIPGNNKNMSSADLYIRMSDKVPQYLYVCNSSGNEDIKVEYLSFQPNIELNEEIFNVK